MKDFIWINGRYLRSSEASISVLDRGFLYGDGLFETLRSYQGWPFRLRDHVDRLKSSARELKIPLTVSFKSFHRVIEKLLHLNRLEDAYLRITLTRGRKEAGFYLAPPSQPVVVVQAAELPDYRSESRKGVRVIVSAAKRSVTAPLVRHKTLNFLDNILARAEAFKQKAFEAIWLNTNGHVCEGSMTNIFAVKRGQVLTPPLGANILPGITREVIFELAARLPARQGRLRRRIRETNLTGQQLTGADEIFLTNSLIEIIPVVKCDDTLIGSGQPGEVTCQLQKAYQSLVRLAN